MKRLSLFIALLGVSVFAFGGGRTHKQPDQGPSTIEAGSYFSAPASMEPKADLNGMKEVALRYTYKAEIAQIPILRDAVGKPYLPLSELADFFGVKWSYQPQTRRIEMTRGDRKVVTVLSQPSALVDGNETLFLAPSEMVDGQVAVEPDAAADLVRAVLNVQALFVAERATLVVGGVSPEDVRQEITQEMSEGIPQAKGKLQEESGDATTNPPPEATLPPPEQRVKTISAGGLKTYKVRRVVIDPGHGGKDGGAKGYDGKFVEKQATLDIALRVVKLLKQQPDLEVLMTRDRDKYITLKYRTEFANRHKADLFVSIHCNANRKSSAKGTETYVYSSRATGSAADAAARENSGGDFMDFVFDDLNHWSYNKRSHFLAEKIDRRIQDRLGQKILRIEQAPFYVLARVNMPSVLVETAFITHKEEERKLKDPEWRQKIAQAIADGIMAYRDGVEDSLERR